MSSRRWIFRLGVAVAVAGLTGLVPGRLEAQSSRLHGRRIEFSGGSGASEVSTNLEEMTTRKDSLKELEDSLSQSLHLFSRGSSSLDGGAVLPYVPPVMPVVPSKRAKSLQERRKDWVFMSPEDLAPGMSLEDFLKLPPGAEEKGQEKLTPMERFYQSLGSADNRNGPDSMLDELLGVRKPPAADSRQSDATDVHLPSGIRDAEQRLQKQLDADAPSGGFSTLPTRGTFADFFGLGDNALSPREGLMHKQRMEEFKQLLDRPIPNPTVAGTGQGGVLDAAQPAGPAPQMGGLDSYLGGSGRRAPAANPAGLDALTHPGMVADPNGAVLNQWNPMYVPPRPEPARMPPPTTPVTQFPRRKFF